MNKQISIALILLMGVCADAAMLRLRSGNVTTVPKGPRMDALDAAGQGIIDEDQVLRVPVTEHDGKGEFVVQFIEEAKERIKRGLGLLGIRVVSYLPDHAYVIMARPEKLQQVAELEGIIWIGGYLPDYKVAPALRTATNIVAAKRLEDGAGALTLEVVISVVLPHYVTDVVLQLEKMGAEVVDMGRSRRWGVIRALIRAEDLAAVASLAAVEWIEPYLPPRLMNNVAVQDDYMNVVPVWTNAGLTGAGQIIAVGDSGLDTGDAATIHPDFSNRIVAAFGWVDTNYWGDKNGHGTHVAGSVLGSGAAYSNGLFKGVAYEADLVFQAIGDPNGSSSVYPPSPLNLLFQQAWSNDAKVHSSSWGSNADGQYTAQSRAADEFMWDFDDMLLVFSAGNAGRDGNSDGVIDEGSLGAPATAKNILTVGAAESLRPSGSGGYSASVWGTGSWLAYYPVDPILNDLISTPWDSTNQGMAAFSSRGPCQDGRTKPDVVAPGTDIISCRSRLPGAGTLWGTGSGVLGNSASNLYCFSGGTSMSTPLVSGAAGLARQYLGQYVGVTNPSSALLKALLVSGARSITPGQYGTNQYLEVPGGARPNNVEGWGQIDLNNTLFPADSLQNMVWDRCLADDGTTNVFEVLVSSSNAMNVTLVWNDYPAALAAAQQLVNDLDLKVIAPDGTVYYPSGGNGPDRTNNVLGIDFSAAQPGTNRIVVSGYNVPQGPQPYALVVRADGEPVAQHAILYSGVVGGRIFEQEPATVKAALTTNSSGIATVVTVYRVNSNAWNYLTMNAAGQQGYAVNYTVDLPRFNAGDVIELYTYALAYNMEMAVSETNRLTVESRTIYVAKGGNNTWPYHSWDTAFTSLTAAADFANAGYTIIVSNGVYRDGTLVLADGIVLETLNGPAYTSIDASGQGVCAYLTGGASVSGMTFTNGYGVQGGGAVVDGGHLTNCWVYRSQAQQYGGGIHLGFAGGTVDSCIIAHNHANVYGGGVLIRAGLIQHTIIRDNSSGSDAGAVEHWGGMISNCTVAFNHSGNYGGGIDVGDPAAQVYNCIMVSNTATVGGANWYEWMDIDFMYCCARPAPEGTDNFDLEPMFADGPGRDLHLLSHVGRYLPDGSWTNDDHTSPCLDMGDPSADYSGEPGPNGGRINLGAYGNTAQASKSSTNVYKLMISSTHGQTAPAAGIYLLPHNMPSSCIITNPVLTGTETQYLQNGWSLMGLVDVNTNTSGSSNSVTFMLTNNVVLSWSWTTNYMLSVYANTNGGLSGVTNGWYTANSLVPVTAQPDSYYAFLQWTGSLTSVANPLSVPMTQSRRLWASFTEALTSNGVPQLWLVGYGWTNNFDVVEMQDADGDGALTWQEYVAGTIPTAATSVLELVTQYSGDGPVHLSWQAMANRTYTLYCGTNLNGYDVTNFMFGVTTLMPMPVSIDDTLHTNDAAIYYRVKVKKN
jgi:hypothetical protein